MRANRFHALLCLAGPVLAGTCLAGPAPAREGAAPGQDRAQADVFGVRLYMDEAQAREALRLALPRETAWSETRIPCADEQGRGPGGPRSCLGASVLAGPTGVVLRYVEDLPARPHRSIVTEAVVSQEPSNGRSKRLFHLALLRKYGRPDLSDATGMQWGQVFVVAGRPTLARTLPMLESSNDEIIRLSDTGRSERQGMGGGTAAASEPGQAGRP